MEENTNLEIFNIAAVQILINSHEAYWHNINRILIGFPMLVQLVTFVYWSNVVITHID